MDVDIAFHLNGRRYCIPADRIITELSTVKLVFYNVLTTSINSHNGKIGKPFAVPKHFPRESSEARTILQTLVIYSIEWALRHCDTVIGECIVPAQPSPSSSWQIAHTLHVAYTSRATLATQSSVQRRYSISALGRIYNARCEPNLPTLSNMKLPAAETDY
jgi:hypothetical protein